MGAPSKKFTKRYRSVTPQLHVTTPDGEPITNEKITIKAHDDKWKTFFTKSYLVTNGVINFEVDEIPPHTKKLYLNVIIFYVVLAHQMELKDSIGHKM